MSSITRVDFVERKVLAHKIIDEGPLVRVYKKLATLVDRPQRVLEVVGEPVDINIRKLFPHAQVTRWMYSHGDNPDLARNYIGMLPPNANYDLIIVTHLIEEYAENPYMLLHRWPDILHRSLGNLACIMHAECPKLAFDYTYNTMQLAYTDVQTLKEGTLTVLMGRGLR